MKNIQTGSKNNQLHFESIEELRKEMVLSGLSKGLNNPETLELSKELDIILNKYQSAKEASI